MLLSSSSFADRSTGDCSPVRPQSATSPLSSSIANSTVFLTLLGALFSAHIQTPITRILLRCGLSHQRERCRSCSEAFGAHVLQSAYCSAGMSEGCRLKSIPLVGQQEIAILRGNQGELAARSSVCCSASCGCVFSGGKLSGAASTDAVTSSTGFLIAEATESRGCMFSGETSGCLLASTASCCWLCESTASRCDDTCGVLS
jgi:hypothetical protein